MSMNKFIHESRGKVMKFTVWFCEFSALKDAKPAVLESETQKMSECIFVDGSILSAYRTSLPVLTEKKNQMGRGLQQLNCDHQSEETMVDSFTDLEWNKTGNLEAQCPVN